MNTTLPTLRKVPLRHLANFPGLSDDEQATLCIALEGRTPEQIKDVYDSLSEEDQFEVWAQGLELNEHNLQRYQERKKRMAAASGMDVDKLVQDAMETKMGELMDQQMSKTEASAASPDSSPKDTDSETSSTITPLTSS